MLRTTLSVAIGQTDNKLVVNSTAYAAISLNTYLELRYGASVEVVKLIDKRNGLLVVLRARDYTEACAFPAGTAVTQVLTEEGIRKQITKGPQLKLYFGGGTFGSHNHIGYYSLDIKYEGVNYSIGSGAEISIGREENAYGCCDGDAEARKGFRYTYYTSKLYPYDFKDGFTAGASFTASMKDAWKRLDYLSGVYNPLTGELERTEPFEAVQVSSTFGAILRENIIYIAEQITVSHTYTASLKDSFTVYRPDTLTSTAQFTAQVKDMIITTYKTDAISVTQQFTASLT